MTEGGKGERNDYVGDKRLLSSFCHPPLPLSVSVSLRWSNITNERTSVRPVIKSTADNWPAIMLLCARDNKLRPDNFTIYYNIAFYLRKERERRGRTEVPPLLLRLLTATLFSVGFVIVAADEERNCPAARFPLCRTSARPRFPVFAGNANGAARRPAANYNCLHNFDGESVGENTEWKG